ncbi:MAG TPA: glycerol-3-phosphate 1-O-acyltransferase PlsY [Longimicrobiales bacterium]|nr:glycerol-3-phosphate 1-O-acyltransferase PlsY [Longimicrobiales bacterium]
MTVLLLVAAYLLGAVPSSYLVARALRGIDLRQHGSGNLGATNTFRVLGWKAATPVFLFDMAKGFGAAALFPAWDGAAGPGWALAYGAAAIVGHVFSIYVRFKGGKGVATSAGVFLAVAPWAVAVGLAAWLVLVALTRVVSLASLVAAAVVPVAVWATQGVGPVLWLSVGLAVFIFYAHRSNLQRLLRGEERGFRTRAPAGEAGGEGP